MTKYQNALEILITLTGEPFKDLDTDYHEEIALLEEACEKAKRFDRIVEYLNKKEEDK